MTYQQDAPEFDGHPIVDQVMAAHRGGNHQVDLDELAAYADKTFADQPQTAPSIGEEFLTSMEFVFPADMHPTAMRALYAAETKHALGLVSSGKIRRLWRQPCTRGNFILWAVPNATELHAELSRLPLWRFATNIAVHALGRHPMDRAAKLTPAMHLDYASLHEFLASHGQPSEIPGEGLTAQINEALSIHDHPASGRPREIHFMVDGCKVAEIGPTGPAPAGSPPEDVAPGYLALMSEWAGQPVGAAPMKARVLADNGIYDGGLYED